MSNEYKDWLHDEEQEKKMKDKKETITVHKPASQDPTITPNCPDCKGGLNAQGKHLDCRTCNNTGVV